MAASRGPICYPYPHRSPNQQGELQSLAQWRLAAAYKLNYLRSFDSPPWRLSPRNLTCELLFLANPVRSVSLQARTSAMAQDDPVVSAQWLHLHLGAPDVKVPTKLIPQLCMLLFN